MNKMTKTILGVSTAGLLAVSLAACSPTSTMEPNNPNPSSSSPSEETPTPLASIDALGGVDTAVTLDQGFVDALTSLGLTPGVTGTATLVDGALHFPITGGNVDYYDPEEDYRPYVQGEIIHDGSGITLTAADGTVVGLSDFVIDPGNNSKLTGTVTVNGEVAGEDVVIFRLDGTTLNPLQEGPNGEAILEGTTVYISEDAAALLNETFGTEAVTGDLMVGIAKITAVPAE